MRRLLMTTALLSGLMAGTAMQASAADFTKEQMEKIFHDYIMENPQVLIDSVNNYQREQQSGEEKKFNDVVAQNSDWLYKNKKHAEAGNPKGDVTIVEFFDYNCGYCKQALGDILTLLDEDKKLRVVFVEIPILGESSVLAARWALAANKQDHYLEYHAALMRHKGAMDEATLERYAKQVGLDVEKLKVEARSSEYDAVLAENLEKSRSFGLSGTPAFIVGGQTVRGYIGIDALRAAIKDARKG